MAQVPAKTAAAAKPDPTEELHFRLDEHERQLAQLGKNLTPETVAAVVHGAVAALHVSMQSETDRMLKAVKDDAEADRGVIAKVDELVSVMRELIQVLKTPTTRRTVLDLPTGPVTVTTHESR